MDTTTIHRGSNFSKESFEGRIILTHEESRLKGTRGTTDQTHRDVFHLVVCMVVNGHPQNFPKGPWRFEVLPLFQNECHLSFLHTY